MKTLKTKSCNQIRASCWWGVRGTDIPRMPDCCVSLSSPIQKRSSVTVKSSSPTSRSVVRRTRSLCLPEECCPRPFTLPMRPALSRPKGVLRTSKLPLLLVSFLAVTAVWNLTKMTSFHRSLTVRSSAYDIAHFPILEPSSPVPIAYQQSFGFFHDLSDEDWHRRQVRARKHKHQANPADKTTAEKNANLWYLENYYPLFTCPDQQRVGVGADGPKWLCDPWRLADNRHIGQHAVADKPNEKCLVYSVGCNGNYIFEDGLVDLIGAGTCEIHIFDLSRDYTRPGDASDKDIHFHRWGLKSSYSDLLLERCHDKKCVTLQEAMEELGHVNRTIDVFKIDCEGCEWTTYMDWIRKDIDIRQILVETHALADKFGVTGISPASFFDDIQRAGFALFSKEPNIFPGINGNCVEWSFVKLSKEFFVPSLDVA